MDPINDLSNLRKKQIAESKSRRSELSKKRLQSICKKKFQTSFIFPLAEFEEAFGEELWGSGLQDSELVERQVLNRIKWNQLRKKVLDKGNGQLRAFSNEIDLYLVEYTGYHCFLVPE